MKKVSRLSSSFPLEGAPKMRLDSLSRFSLVAFKG